MMTNYEFLSDPDAREIFGKLDYNLKDGRHLQYREADMQQFKFLQTHHVSLREYYLAYFNVLLEKAGEHTETFYYLDFTGQNRGEIPHENRYFLKSEHVIIGLLLYKIVFNDKNFELNSVKQLQAFIKRDYESFKPAIYHLLAKAKKSVVSPTTDGRIDEVIEDTLKEFRRLGWVELKDDYFDVLPSFQRLVNLYGDEINNVDEWITQFEKK